MTPKEVRAKWTAALRSGEYVKTRNKLHKLDPTGKYHSYCCLGVLCDLAVKEGIIPPAVEKNSPYIFGYKDDTLDGHSFSSIRDNDVPQKVRTWSGLCDSTGAFSPIEEFKGVKFKSGSASLNNLAQINDHTDLTFSDLADFIESEPKGLICDSETSTS